jgi:hypothetical protein
MSTLHLWNIPWLGERLRMEMLIGSVAYGGFNFEYQHSPRNCTHFCTFQHPYPFAP